MALNDKFLVSYLFPIDLLDYFSLGIDVVEQLYIELNYNTAEQDHRFIKKLVNLGLEFQSFYTAREPLGVTKR
jgi:hypothetical protein